MPLTASEIIKKSIELYRQNLILFLKYMLILFIPSALIGLISFLVGPFLSNVSTYGMGAPMLIYMIVFVLSFFVSIWVSISFVRIISQKIKQEKELELINNLQNSIHLIWPVILILILTGLIVLGGLILLIIPGLIFAIWLAFAYYAVIIDGEKPVASLKTSKFMVKGRWWNVTWLLLAPAAVFSLILLVVNGIVNLPYDLILKNAFGTTSGWGLFISLIFVLINTAVNLFFAPLSTIAPIILYYELKNNPKKNE